jgi:RNA polymerase sigma-70 factor, ECF subfamily
MARDARAANAAIEPALPDQELVGRICRGDTTALAALYDRYAPLLYATSVRMLGSRAEAEDLLHDVFLEAWQSAKKYDAERGSVRTWLLVRLRSRALDRLGRALLEAPSAEADAAPPRSGASPSLNDRLAIQEALDQLDADVRAVLELVYFSGLTGREIAEKVGVPLGTVKSRLARGLEALEKLLHDPEDPPQ